MYDLNSVRAQLQVLSEYTYLNTGSFGIMAEPVLARHLERIATFERSGHVGYADAQEGYEVGRQALAHLIGSRPDDVGLGRSTTEAVNWALQSIRVRPGSEVITTTDEHPGLTLPIVGLARRKKLTIRYLDSTPDADAMLDQLAELASSRTAVVAISHVSTDTGTRFPVERMRQILPRTATLIVDTAQSLGVVPVSVDDLNADIIVGNAYKWLCGPKSTGFVWLGPHLRGLRDPDAIGPGALAGSWSFERYQLADPGYRFHRGARRFEYRSRPFHVGAGIADAIGYLDALGWGSIQGHMEATTDAAKSLLGAIRGVTILSPPAYQHSSALVAFSVEGVSGERLHRLLWHRGFIQRATARPGSVRISCSYFTTTDDLTRLANAVEAISAGRHQSN